MVTKGTHRILALFTAIFFLASMETIHVYSHFLSQFPHKPTKTMQMLTAVLQGSVIVPSFSHLFSTYAHSSFSSTKKAPTPVTAHFNSLRSANNFSWLSVFTANVSDAKAVNYNDTANSEVVETSLDDMRQARKCMEDFVGCQKKHFVLIHGASHGAWCWYKVKPLLESSGHRVTALDLTGAGINLKPIEEVYSFSEYTQPLLDFLSSSVQPNEKVTLVGHSLGGMNISLAMEKFPEKIDVAIFLTAFMPDTKNQPSYVIEEYNRRVPEVDWLDNKSYSYGKPELQLEAVVLEPKFLALKLYQLSPAEDLALAKSLLRPSSLFVHDLSKSKKFTEERYGSVKRAFILSSEDKDLTEEFQLWMIENSPVDEVMELKGTDHMAMLSGPQEVARCLLKIARKY